MNDWLLATAVLSGFVVVNYAAWKFYLWLCDRRDEKRAAEVEMYIAKMRADEDR